MPCVTRRIRLARSSRPHSRRREMSGAAAWTRLRWPPRTWAVSSRPPAPRERFGTGSLAAPYERSVFINCPFDDEFVPLFEAIVFATVCSGFMPRSALESGSVAVPRMARIWSAVNSSKYSIHDLSRCRGEGEERLARFNMPLELGMAMARSYAGAETGMNHDWLVLVPEGHQYFRFVSDLAGFDPSQHAGTIESIVPAVVVWLQATEDAVEAPNPRAILDALPAFGAEMARLRAAWVRDVPWAEIVLAARRLAPEP